MANSAPLTAADVAMAAVCRPLFRPCARPSAAGGTDCDSSDCAAGYAIATPIDSIAPRPSSSGNECRNGYVAAKPSEDASAQNARVRAVEPVDHPARDRTDRGERRCEQCPRQPDLPGMCSAQVEQQGPAGLIYALDQAADDTGDDDTDQQPTHDERRLGRVRHRLHRGQAAEHPETCHRRGHGCDHEQDAHAGHPRDAARQRADRGTAELAGEQQREGATAAVGRDRSTDERERRDLHRSSTRALRPPKHDVPASTGVQQESKAANGVHQQAANEHRAMADPIAEVTERVLQRPTLR